MGKDPSQFVPIKYGVGLDGETFPIINILIGSLFVMMLLRLYKQYHGKGKGGSAKPGSKGGGMGSMMGGANDVMGMSKSGATIYGTEKKIRKRFKHD